MHVLKLPHFSNGPPPAVAVVRIPQIETREFLEAASRVEARSQFICQRLMVDEAVDAGRNDGFFIETHCVRIARLQPSDLGTYQRSTVLEIFGAMHRPNCELLVMSFQGIKMIRIPIQRAGIA